MESLDLKEAAEVVHAVNARVAETIGIKPAARTTCVKPSGTSSLVLGCSSGVHAWHSEYYIRRLRVGKDEAIYKYLAEKMPQLVEDCFEKPHLQAVISIPQKANEGATKREDESAISLLERVKKLNEQWIKPGHHKGENTHNVSTTVSLKGDEWSKVGEWMWQNRECYNGIAVLPYWGGTYKQAPFEECDQETYDKLNRYAKRIDLTEVRESDDNTEHTQEIACAGGKCEI